MKHMEVLMMLYSLQKLLQKEEYDAAKELLEELINLYEIESR